MDSVGFQRPRSPVRPVRQGARVCSERQNRVRHNPTGTSRCWQINSSPGSLRGPLKLVPEHNNVVVQAEQIEIDSA